MSKNLDYLKSYFDEVSSNGGYPDTSQKWAKAHLSEDFQFLDKDGKATMDKAAYLGFGDLLLSSFNDMKFFVGDIRDDGDAVKITSHWEGTFTGNLDLSAMGMGIIAADGKKVVWPESTSRWKIDGEKVLSIQDFSTGGIAEFLAPLGVKLPSM